MKKFIVRLLLIAAGLLPVAMPTTALAIDLGRVDSDALTIGLNLGQMNTFGRFGVGTQLMTNTQRVIRCTFDFARLGGAVSTISLRSSTTDALNNPLTTCLLPKGAIIMETLIDTITTPTSSGSATIALSTGQVAADLLAATAYGSVTGILAGIPLGTAATAIKLTADRTPTATIATAALTAGKFYVLISYILSQTL